jgi:hypothetical protein
LSVGEKTAENVSKKRCDEPISDIEQIRNYIDSIPMLDEFAVVVGHVVHVGT